MDVKAYGTFETFNSQIFRTNASLQFGHSSKPIGMVIMLNPGASRLAVDEEWDFFLSKCEVDDRFSIFGELVLDQTMKSLVEIFSMVNPKQEGIIQLYNIFNYRCGNSQQAIRNYSSFLKDSLYSSTIHSPISDMDNIPWVWIAWSVADAAVLNKRKIEILEKVPKHKKISLYSEQRKHQSRKELYCYHPCPQQQKTRTWVREIVSELLFEKIVEAK